MPFVPQASMFSDAFSRSSSFSMVSPSPSSGTSTSASSISPVSASAVAAPAHQTSAASVLPDSSKRQQQSHLAPPSSAAVTIPRPPMASRGNSVSYRGGKSMAPGLERKLGILEEDDNDIFDLTWKSQDEQQPISPKSCSNVCPGLEERFLRRNFNPFYGDDVVSCSPPNARPHWEQHVRNTENWMLANSLPNVSSPVDRHRRR